MLGNVYYNLLGSLNQNVQKNKAFPDIFRVFSEIPVNRLNTP